MKNAHIYLVLLATSALAGVPHKMVAGQPARADSVNANFDYLSAKIDSILLVKIDSIKLSTLLAAKVDTNKLSALLATKADTGSVFHKSLVSGEYSLYRPDSSKSFFIGGSNPYSLGMKVLSSWGNYGYNTFLSAEWINGWEQVILNGKLITLYGEVEVTKNLTCEKDLIVNGQIHASTGTIAVPDYVFDPSYKLMPLSEVDAFIKTNRHLPEIPTASETQAQGMDLARYNLLLLKKIEELTLHAIQLQKQIDDHASRIRDLQSR